MNQFVRTFVLGLLICSPQAATAAEGYSEYLTNPAETLNTPAKVAATAGACFALNHLYKIQSAVSSSEHEIARLQYELSTLDAQEKAGYIEDQELLAQTRERIYESITAEEEKGRVARRWRTFWLAANAGLWWVVLRSCWCWWHKEAPKTGATPTPDEEAKEEE